MGGGCGSTDERIGIRGNPEVLDWPEAALPKRSHVSSGNHGCGTIGAQLAHLVTRSQGVSITGVERRLCEPDRACGNKPLNHRANGARTTNSHACHRSSTRIVAASVIGAWQAKRSQA